MSGVSKVVFGRTHRAGSSGLALAKPRCILTSEMDTETDGAVESALCIRCLHPNDPERHFCDKCGAPLDSYANTAPFEQTLAQGHAFRGAMTQRPRLIVVIGIWAICAPCVIAVVASAFVMIPAAIEHPVMWVMEVFLIFLGVLSALLIYFPTRQYLTARNEEEMDPSEAPSESPIDPDPH